MKDLQLNSIFLINIIGTALIALFFILKFRLLQKYKTAINQNLLLIKKQDIPIFYSSFAIKQHCSYFHSKPRKTNPITLALIAIKNFQQANTATLKAIKKYPHNWKLQLLYAELCLLHNNRLDFTHTINNLQLPFFVPTALKATYYRLSALNELYKTDMLTASTYASRALRFYKKNHFAYEQGECYLTLAQIYRISGVFDVAFTMLQEAEKIFKTLDINAKLAETKAYIGILELGRENYTTAKQYLEDAETICIKQTLYKTLADINNWHGLIEFQEQDYSSAQKNFKKTQNNKNASLPAKSFALEMLARIAFKKNDYTNALNYTHQATQINHDINHRPGIFETLYLEAEILYASGNIEQSEKILTTLIKEKYPAHTIYYPANAYTLLGLINLKQNNLNKATTLFKQAIDLENSQNRLKGAAIDYNNLAEIAYIKGEKNEAQQYLKQALSYAEELEDEELKAYLKTKLKD